MRVFISIFSLYILWDFNFKFWCDIYAVGSLNCGGGAYKVSIFFVNSFAHNRSVIYFLVCVGMCVRGWGGVIRYE